MTEATSEVNEEQIDQQIADATARELANVAGISLPEKVVEEEPTVDDSATEDQEKQDEPELEIKEEAPAWQSELERLRDENQKLRKNIDTTNGRFGNEIQKLNKRIESLNQPNQRLKLDNLSPDNPAFQQLKTDYPELAQAFIESMRNALVYEEVKEDVAPDLLAQPNSNASNAISDELRNIKEAYEFSVQKARDELEETHEDWYQTAHFDLYDVAPGFTQVKWLNNDFGKFVESLCDDDRYVVMNGESPQEILRISKILTQFKNSSAPKETQLDGKPIQKQKPNLLKATLPTGKAPASVGLTEDEQIEAAMRREMKRAAGLL